MILVVGGRGTLGRLVAERLFAEGDAVRVMTRTPQALARDVDTMRGLEVVRGDLLDRSSLMTACRGARAVVAAAHSIFGRGRHASSQVDGEGHRALIDVARAAGVEQFVYVSVQTPHQSYASVPFFGIKRMVEDYLAHSGLRHTILRPTAFIDFHAHVLIGEKVMQGRRVTIIGPGRNPRNFVAAADVAEFVRLALRDPARTGSLLEIGGPQDLSALDIVRTYEQRSGQRALTRHLPLAMARLAARVLRPVHPGVGQVLQMAVLGETAPQAFDATPLRRFGIPLTTLDEWITQRTASTLSR